MFHVLAGAVLGAVVGGAASAITSVVKGEKINWKKVGAAAVGGAVAGGVGALTFGAGALAGSAVTKVGGMVAAGAMGGASEQVTDNVLHDETWHEGVAESAAVGAAIGAAGGVLRVGAKPLANLARSGAGRLSSVGNALSRGARQRAGSALSPVRRWAGRLLKPVTEAAKRRLGRALAPVARSMQRRVIDPLKSRVLEPLQRRVFSPIARRLEPVFRPLKPVFRPVGRAWDKYKRLLDTAPIRTKSATSATIAMTGDVIAQAAEGREEWDWKRTLFRGGFAALWSGPMGHHWFAALDRWIPGNTWGAVVSKIGLDQFLWAPISGTVFFSSYSMIYDGMTPGETVERVKRDLPRALKAQYTVWPAFHLFNFRYVPLNMRVPASASAGLGWSVFFSTLLSDSEAEDGGEEPAHTQGTRTIDGGLGEACDDEVVVTRAVPHPGAVSTVFVEPQICPDPALAAPMSRPGVVEGFGITETLGSFGPTSYAPGLMPQR